MDYPPVAQVFPGSAVGKPLTDDKGCFLETERGQDLGEIARRFALLLHVAAGEPDVPHQSPECAHVAEAVIPLIFSESAAGLKSEDKFQACERLFAEYGIA